MRGLQRRGWHQLQHRRHFLLGIFRVRLGCWPKKIHSNIKFIKIHHFLNMKIFLLKFYFYLIKKKLRVECKKLRELVLSNQKFKKFENLLEINYKKIIIKNCKILLQMLCVCSVSVICVCVCLISMSFHKETGISSIGFDRSSDIFSLTCHSIRLICVQ